MVEGKLVTSAGSVSLAGLLCALLGVACSDVERVEHTGRSQGAILSGRLSGDDENAAVLVTSSADRGPSTCSGRVIVPRLVLTARHCLLRDNSVELSCNPDGSPKDVATQRDQTLVTADRVTVSVGSDRATLRQVAVLDIVAGLDVSACANDVAFLVLRTEALSTRTPIRRVRARVGEMLVVSGWGKTADNQPLPSTRSTLDALRVTDVGPGFIPGETFATDGNTLCQGDSGSVALVRGAAAGVYSRIDGTVCAARDARNVFTDVATQTALIERAFAAIGEPPVYEESADAGPACAGPACGAEGGVAPVAPAVDQGGCDVAPQRRHPRPSMVAFLALAVGIALVWRRRRGFVRSRQRCGTLLAP